MNGRPVHPDPSALQRQVDEITGAPPIVRGLGLIAGPYGGASLRSPDLGIFQKVARRGTTNGNARGGADDRARRRAWLVHTYRADLDALVVRLANGGEVWLDTTLGAGEPACRCYRCGRLLTVDTVTVDRIVPGCRGGRYTRNNIRPACQPCNSEIGGGFRAKPKKAVRAKATRRPVRASGPDREPGEGQR